jgi:hypothetical protein
VSTFQALMIFCFVMLIGFILFLFVMYLAELITKRTYNIRSLFKDFNQKMWMTVGLGITFLGLYFAIIYLASFVKDPQIRLDFFFQLYKHPVLFIYLGLLTCVTVSILIVLTRMVIKFYYNTKRKG